MACSWPVLCLPQDGTLQASFVLAFNQQSRQHRQQLINVAGDTLLSLLEKCCQKMLAALCCVLRAACCGWFGQSFIT
jgi:hypothetical protein